MRFSHKVQEVNALKEGLFHASVCQHVISLCLIKHHAMKTYGGMEVQIHSFFDLGTR
jgi:hypothetical protein